MLGKRLVPGSAGEHTGVQISIDFHGMRDREYDARKPPRLAAHPRPRRFLDSERIPGPTIEALHVPVAVMNTGVSGYETSGVLLQRARSRIRARRHVDRIHAKDKKYARYRRLYNISPLLLDLYNLPKHLYVSQLYNNWRVARKACEVLCEERRAVRRRRQPALQHRARTTGPSSTPTSSRAGGRCSSRSARDRRRRGARVCPE